VPLGDACRLGCGAAGTGGDEVGDAAGFAAALAKKQRVPPAALDSDLLIRTLCQAGFLVSFFNEQDALQPALQYFARRVSSTITTPGSMNRCARPPPRSGPMALPNCAPAN